MATKTFANKVGTPRGYVDKAARDKVDEAMQPIAEVGKELLWLTPMGRGFRGAKAAYEGGKALLRGSTKQVAKEVVKEAAPAAAKAATKAATKGAVRGGGGMRAPRPARGIKPDSKRQEILDSLKQGPKRPTEARDIAPGSKRQEILDSLKQGPKRPTAAKDVSKGSARDAAFKEAKAAQRSATRKPRPGEKQFIGPMNRPQPGDRRFIGPANKPKPGDKTFIGPANRPQPGEKNFIGPMNRPARPGDKNFIGPRERPRAGDKDFIGPTPRAPKPGEKGFIGPMRGSTAARNFGGKMAAGAAAGAGLLGFAAYNSADKPKASDNKANNSKLTSGARDDRASSGSGKADAFKKKQQGMKVPGSPTNPDKAGTNKAKPKKAVDKSSAAAKPEKKMSNFERMKKRGYEKEGLGGRALTSRGAESRVKKERSYKFKDLFKKKK
jgi:hypothetical protein